MGNEGRRDLLYGYIVEGRREKTSKLSLGRGRRRGRGGGGEGEEERKGRRGKCIS